MKKWPQVDVSVKDLKSKQNKKQLHGEPVTFVWRQDVSR
jgi:hypothetical protein